MMSSAVRIPSTTFISLISVFRPLRHPLFSLPALRRLNMTTDSTITIPDGFTLHTENSSQILLSSNEAFLNPVQEFNRDISVACIRVWSEEMAKVKEKSWLMKRDRKKRKGLALVLSRPWTVVTFPFSGKKCSAE
jgi:hypothetical protein